MPSVFFSMKPNSDDFDPQGYNITEEEDQLVFPVEDEDEKKVKEKLEEEEEESVEAILDDGIDKEPLVTKIVVVEEEEGDLDDLKALEKYEKALRAEEVGEETIAEEEI